ncbi:Tfp pilus assembly protein ATPase PilM [Synergistales bacterium]|nr:Tfp pilus assembly protein ATPase PilM [Synergistales bacterium]
MAKSSKKGNFAGLALHGDSLRYIELSGDKGSLQVVRKEKTPLSHGVVVKDVVADWEGVISALKSMKSVLGGAFRCPVTMGMPSRDVILRLVDYPKMPIEDVKAALELEFDKYFPYAYQEAAADVVEVDVPSNFDGGEKTVVLVATCKYSVMADMMRAASAVGLNLSAVEPMNVAFFRAVVGAQGQEGGYFVVFVEPESTQIILGYKDNGILFRSSAVDLTSPDVRDSDDGLMPILRDVQNTVIFSGNQYKGLAVENIILGGILGKKSRLGELLESTTSMPVADLDVGKLWGSQSGMNGSDGFEAAFGLAARALL